MSESPTSGTASVEAEQGGAAPPPRNIVTEDVNAIVPGVATLSQTAAIQPQRYVSLHGGLSPCGSVSKGNKWKVVWIPHLR